MSAGKAKWLLLVLLPGLFLLVTANTVWAAEPTTLELQAPNEVNLGDEVTVTAVLKDGKGMPVRGAAIILWTTAEFLSKGGAIELDRAVTDEQGRVTFRSQVRSEGSVTLNASFAGDSLHDSAQGSAKVTVQGSTQLTRHPIEGVRVPGIGVWILAAILGGVWGTYLTVMVFLTLIAREGSKTPQGAGGQHG